MDLTDVVKAMLVPGSMGFLLFGLTLGLILLLASQRTRRWGLGWLCGLALVYCVLSLPVTASALEGMLDSGQEPLTTLEAGQGSVAILVLGGGSDTFRAQGMALSSPSETTALRSMEGARVYHLADDALVVASGGPGGESGKGEPESSVIRRLLEANGVPPGSIREEAVASSTREEALLLADILTGLGIDQVIVATSPTHMRRALGALAAAGIHATGSPSLEHSETPRAANRFLPGEQALGDSRQALRETMALIYYAARGWLAPAGIS
ncbi:MAG: YdcF family protein [Chloroflexi bacterium]|nr:YdcF family protein [Chloroflexota bacterium]